MKFSLTNVNAFFIVIIILICSSILSYISIFNGLLFSDLILVAKFFLVIIILVNIFMIGFVIYKFRVITIYSNEIRIIYPFRFLIIESRIDKLKGIKWSNYIDTKAVYYRKLSFKTENNKTITICDKEFENLDFLAKSLNFDVENKNLKKLNIERAKANKSNQFINVVFAIFLSCSLIYIAANMETWNYIKTIFYSITSIIVVFFLIFNIKKYLIYKKNIC
jgi:hypothetical protein